MYQHHAPKMLSDTIRIAKSQMLGSMKFMA
jgi:hypothetical protein